MYLDWFSQAGAQTITGKVVGVSDGDTITVLQDRTQYKIRLYGIDCPEKSQDFGNRAKKFVSGMVYGKQVQVIQKDMDRYGRVVGMVYVGNTCVNEEIVRAGLAWVFHRYCKDSFCRNGLILRPRQGLQRSAYGHILTRYHLGIIDGETRAETRRYLVGISWQYQLSCVPSIVLQTLQL